MKYISAATATPEVDSDGLKFIIVKVSNPGIKELKSAEERYIEFKQQTMNPNDSTDKQEMVVSKQIRDEIHSIWKLLNP